jgi:hypothetical protein
MRRRSIFAAVNFRFQISDSKISRFQAEITWNLKFEILKIFEINKI